MHIFGEGLSFGMGEFWGGTLIDIGGGVIWTCSFAGGISCTIHKASKHGWIVGNDRFNSPTTRIASWIKDSSTSFPLSIILCSY